MSSDAGSMMLPMPDEPAASAPRRDHSLLRRWGIRGTFTRTFPLRYGLVACYGGRMQGVFLTPTVVRVKEMDTVAARVKKFAFCGQQTRNQERSSKSWILSSRVPVSDSSRSTTDRSPIPCPLPSANPASPVGHPQGRTAALLYWSPS